MYQTILKKFSEDGIHLNDEQANFLRIFEKNLPRKSFFVDFFKEKSKKNQLLLSNYGHDFTAMIGKENILGTQFHPEKSQKFGLDFLSAFINWDSRL